MNTLPLNILAFFAHPDDETMLCGGTLALLSQIGARVHLMVSTRGEGGEMGEPPVCSREELGKVREAELRCAAQALGISSLILLDYIDPLIGPDNQLYPFTENRDELVQKVVEEIHKTGAQVLISHGVNGEYGHPAHQLVYQAAEQAVRQMGSSAPLLYTAQGFFAESPYPRLLNVDAPAHLLLDVNPVLTQKTDAALCHLTQHGLFVRFMSTLSGRKFSVPEVVQPIESLTRVYPPFDGSQPLPHDVLADLLLQSGLARQP